MEIEVALPLDHDGFLRRECPSCEREFKWFYGETADRPDNFLDPPLYTCPYCGEAAGHDSWWTKEQLEFAQAMAVGPAMDMITDELARAFRKTPGIRFKPSYGDWPDRPMPPVEPDDMTMVASPCHGFEPVKIADDWTEPLYCLICGQAFRL